MARIKKTTPTTPSEAVISIIGAGMTLTGDCETDGVLRIEGTVKGDVRAGKAVVVGKDALVDGNIYTQDAVIAGGVLGSVHAESSLEVQSTGRISGEIDVRRMQLEEGATLEGQVSVGESRGKAQPKASTREKAAGEGTPEGDARSQGIPGGPAPDGVTHGDTSIVSASPEITRPPASPKRSKPLASPDTPPGMKLHEEPTAPPTQGEGRPS
jgi:cytoskeletal protein CcmA (bactofilin family)